MRLLGHEIITEADLLARLKRTRLRGFARTEVYRDSTLEIVGIQPANLLPTQNYVLRDNVQVILDLADEFGKCGIDIFHLRGGLIFRLEGENGSIPFLPPIVEESPEGLIINDGMHRIWAASCVGSTINIVLVRNVPAEYPYYAHPLENGWADVREVSEAPDTRKRYRNPENYKALFRDFNEQFEGVQKQRVRK